MEYKIDVREILSDYKSSSNILSRNRANSQFRARDARRGIRNDSTMVHSSSVGAIAEAPTLATGAV